MKSDNNRENGAAQMRITESIDGFAGFLRVRGVRHGAAESTVSAYTSALRRFAALVGDPPVPELCADHVIRYKAHLMTPVSGDTPPPYKGQSARDRQEYIVANWPRYSPASIAAAVGIDGPALSRIVSTLRLAGFSMKKKGGRQRRERASSAFIAAEIAAITAYAAYLHSVLKLTNIAPSDIQPLRPRAASTVPQAGDRFMIDELMDAAASDDDRLIIALMYFAGLRRREVADLRYHDVQAASAIDAAAPEPDHARHEYRLVVKGKGGKTRVIPVAQALYPLLHARMSELPARAGENPRIVYAGYNGIWRRVRAAAGRAGLTGNIHPHVMRHTSATVMLEQGADIRTIQAFLGHESIQTTARYAQVRDGRVKNAVGTL